MNVIDEMAKQRGFADASELQRMVASVDFSLPDMPARFKRWQAEDRSKAGLEALSRMEGEPNA